MTPVIVGGAGTGRSKKENNPPTIIPQSVAKIISLTLLPPF